MSTTMPAPANAAVAPPTAFLVVSGGAETVSLDLVQWAWRHGLRCAVFALREPSLVRDLPGVCAFASVPHGIAQDDAIAALLQFAASLPRLGDRTMPAYPTDDDSLRLLLQAGGLPGIEFSRCRQLPLGGLDKAELFDALHAAGLADLAAPTVVLRVAADIDAGIARLGRDVVVKRSMKPWARDHGEGGMKVLDFLQPDAATLHLVLDDLLAAGETWLMQARLQPLDGGERSACVVAGGGGLAMTEVVELWKYPRRGGSACWVRTQPDSRRLHAVAGRIATTLDLVGIAEMSFLADAAGAPRLLELNCRPWLQFGLVLDAGFDMVAMGNTALTGGKVTAASVIPRDRDWVSLERILAATGVGDLPRLEGLRCMVDALRRKPLVSVWSSRMPGVRRRWLARLLRRLLGRS